MDEKVKVTNKCPICGRPTHKESKYCIFHANAEEKTEEEFKQALKEYVKKLQKEDRDYDFSEFIFVGNISFKKDLNVTILKNADFMGSTFKGGADFEDATFKGDANFRKATFKGDANFRKATFKGDANFRKATFEVNAYFREAIFGGYATFWEAIFEGNAYFREAIFGGNADFMEAIFEVYTEFWKATFGGYADFREATLTGNADFREATFEDDADFRLEYLVRSVNFSRIKVFSGKRLFIKLKNERGEISFERAYLENIYLDIELVEGGLINFTGALLKNTKIKKGQIENHILQEEKKEFSEAQEIYLLLKNNFHGIGQYEDESWAFTKERDMERLSQSFPYYKVDLKYKSKKENFLPILKWIRKGNFKKWIISTFSNMIYGYGEKPWNVIFSAGILIFIFALLFSLIGIGNPEIIELKGTGIYQNSGNIVDLASKGFLKNNVIRNFPDCLYFSLITFTTLGYGDFRPLEGWGRILAGSEAFIGAFMMALFVYTFARRTGGR